MRSEYWQVGAGEGDRDYSGVFLRFGVAFGGSADKGSYENDPKYYDDNPYVVTFKKEMSIGDRVILKKPHGNQWEIVAVSEISSDYEYFHSLDDLDGWNVAHGRRVNWVKPKQKKYIKGLARGTVLRVQNESVKREAERILQSGTPLLPKEDVPPPPKELRDEDIVEELINNGLRPSDAENFTETIRRVRLLARWYLEHENIVLEHETRTFLIMPLLLALGWSEQRLKIEWNKMDVAFFKKPFTEDNDTNNPCIMILESKKLSEGLTYAQEQGTAYTENFPHCHKLIVSNGYCYKVFDRIGKTWKWKSYLNILKPRPKHPYEKGVSGATDVFLSLMPQSF